MHQATAAYLPRMPPPHAQDRTARFAEWVRAYTGELLRYTRARVKDDAEAEDLVQLAFMAAWEAQDRFAGESSPRTWLFAILKHKLMDHYRRAYREAERLSGAVQEADHLLSGLFDDRGHWREGHRPQQVPEFDEPDNDERLDRALRQCLEALPGDWRQAVEMKYLMEEDAATIQETLDLKPANYWQRLHRAKLKLRACIEERLSKYPT